MTGYHIRVGYNCDQSEEDVGATLREVVDEICETPEHIVAELNRVEPAIKPPPHYTAKDYADSYRKPWADSTISVKEEDRELHVMQLAGGSGEYKHAMRRAFCRLVMNKMHKAHMNISITVA